MMKLKDIHQDEHHSEQQYVAVVGGTRHHHRCCGSTSDNYDEVVSVDDETKMTWDDDEMLVSFNAVVDRVLVPRWCLLLLLLLLVLQLHPLQLPPTVHAETAGPTVPRWRRRRSRHLNPIPVVVDTATPGLFLATSTSGISRGCCFVTTTRSCSAARHVMGPRNNRLRRRSIYESSSLASPFPPQRGQHHHCHHHHQRRHSIYLCRSKQKDDDSGDYGGFALEWDDFGDQVIGGGGDIAENDTGNSNNEDDKTTMENTTIFEHVDEQMLIGGDDMVVVPSSNTVWSSTRSALSERIQTVQITEQKQTARLARNWNLGNWQVRGFVLPPPGPNETLSSMNVDGSTTATTASAAVITHIVQVVTSGGSISNDDDIDDDDDNNNDLVWVARSDGCIFGVHLGTAYMTKLGSNDDNDENAAEDATTKPYAPSQQRLEWSNDNDDDEDDSMNDRIATASSRTRPFEIVARLSIDDPSAAAIMSLAVVETDSSHDDVDGSTLLLFAAVANGTIQKWKVTWKEDVVDDPKSPLIDHCPTLERALSTHNEVSGTTVLALQPIVLKSTTLQGGTDPLHQPQQLLLAVDANSLTLWDCESGTLQGHVRVTSPLDDGRNPTAEQDPVVSSAHANGVHIYVGTRSGHVVAYAILDVLQQASTTTTMSPVLPAGQWRASNDPITAIACGGAGTLGRGRADSKTTVLYTGDGNGMVKQWEVFTTASRNIEAWPKLATQRLPKKAHVFSGHYGAVTAIRTIDSVKFVTAADDGTVRVWNSASGKEMCRMDGFTHTLRSLCLFDGDNNSDDVVPSSVATRNALLVTDGMDNCVCVHDFSVDNEDDDFELEMPEYR